MAPDAAHARLAAVLPAPPPARAARAFAHWLASTPPVALSDGEVRLWWLAWRLVEEGRGEGGR